MKLQDLKTIIITGKEWFDRANGNSYCSARATINFGMDDETYVVVPFQYGYGDTYKQETFSAVSKLCGCTADDVMRNCYNGNIKTHSTKQERCTKAEVKSWGQE